MWKSNILTKSLLAVSLLVASATAIPAAADTPDPNQRAVIGIEQKQNIKAVFQINSGEMAEGVHKGLLKLDNTVTAYIKEGVDPAELHIHAVFHGDASEHLLTDEAWNRLKNTTGGNPSTELITRLAKRGTHIEFCNTRRIRNGWEMKEIHPDVALVSSAYHRLIDLQLRGFAIVRP